MKRLALIGATLAALLLPLGTSATAVTPTAARGDDATAHVWSRDGVLGKGCPGHRYRYSVDVPAGDSWMLEIFLVNKKGRWVASAFENKGGDPKAGKGTLLFCSLDVKPGRYQVRARLTWSHYSDETILWAKPRTIQLHRP